MKILKPATVCNFNGFWQSLLAFVLNFPRHLLAEIKHPPSSPPGLLLHFSRDTICLWISPSQSHNYYCCCSWLQQPLLKSALTLDCGGGGAAQSTAYGKFSRIKIQESPSVAYFIWDPSTVKVRPTIDLLQSGQRRRRRRSNRCVFIFVVRRGLLWRFF